VLTKVMNTTFFKGSNKKESDYDDNDDHDDGGDD
jgi:hypothetical protein